MAGFPRFVSEEARTALERCETTEEISKWAETYKTYGVATFLNNLKSVATQKDVGDASNGLWTAIVALAFTAKKDSRLLLAAHNKIYPPTTT